MGPVGGGFKPVGGTAAAFLRSAWSVRPDRVAVSVDTGTDLAMFQMGCRGVVVGNAHAELRQLDSDLIHQAAGQHAFGVIEGLERLLRTIGADAQVKRRE